MFVTLPRSAALTQPGLERLVTRAADQRLDVEEAEARGAAHDMTVIDRALSSVTFPRLVATLGFPGVEYGGKLVEGEPAWRTLLAAATRPERRQFLQLLKPRMERANAYAEARIQRWQQARSAVPTDEWLHEHLFVVGEPEHLRFVVESLRYAPAYVRYITALEVAFVCGDSHRGFLTGARFQGREGGGREQLIVLGPEVAVALVLHEVGHAFLEEPSPPSGPRWAAGVQQEAAIAAWADQEGLTSRLEASIDRHELLADGLAAAWLEGTYA